MEEFGEFQQYIKQVEGGDHLSIEEAEYAFKLLLQGKIDHAQIEALLLALNKKSESTFEIIGAARALHDHALKIKAPLDAIDVCGTGGDNLCTLNISTAVAFVVAGHGIPVAKHGNKAVSSKSGSADVLIQLGVKVDADTALVEKSLSEANLCFMMAPKFHTAMRHVAPVRAKMKVRTIFNLLGPLCNPAAVKHQLMGVYDEKGLKPMVGVLQALGSESAWVVHGSDGLDELTTTGASYVAALKDNKITEFEITPEDAGLPRATIADLKGGDSAYNAERLKSLLEGKKDAYRDIVLLNAAAALIVAGKADNLKQAVAIAAEAIDKGKAKAVLDNLIRITNSSK